MTYFYHDYDIETKVTKKALSMKFLKCLTIHTIIQITKSSLSFLNFKNLLINLKFSPFTEEIITKRKTELTTTKQIETRVKRQVKFEDGKVIEDSGPIVSTASKNNSRK